MEKKQLEMKTEHEKQLIGLERKFQRQLVDARRKSEGLIESLRLKYEDEVDSLKSTRNELIARNKDFERELERARGEAEVLKQRVNNAELQRHYVENAQRQSELVISFLEKCPSLGGKDIHSVREELSALSSGAGEQLLRDRGGGHHRSMWS